MNEFGDYLIYRGTPTYKILIYGRSDMYGTAILKEYYRVIKFEQGWETALDKYRIDWLFFGSKTPLSRFILTQKNWVLIYSDSVANIFVKYTKISEADRKVPFSEARRTIAPCTIISQHRPALMENSWIYVKRSRYETAWPICASLCLHAILILVLNTTSPLNLVVGRESRFDLFWISPLSVIPSPSTAPGNLDTAPKRGAESHEVADTEKVAEGRKVAAVLHEPADIAAVEVNDLAVTLPPAAKEVRTAPEKSTVPQPVVPSAIESRPVVIHKKKERRKEAAAKIEADDETAMAVNVIKAVPAAVEPPAETVHAPVAQLVQPVQPRQQESRRGESARQGKRVVFPPVPRPALLLSKPATLHVAQAPKEVSASPFLLGLAAMPAEAAKSAPPATSDMRRRRTNPPAKVAKVASPAVAAPHAVLPAPPPHAPKPSTVQHARQSKPVSSTSLQRQEYAPPSGKMAPRAGARIPAAAPAKPTTTANDNSAVDEKKPANAAEEAPEPKGLVVHSLRGDLKMVISGDSDIRLFVTFRPYSKPSRDRLSRSQAAEQQKVLPLVARIKPETKEAVIETAREGVYTFAAESERRDGAKAAFTLKIFESGNREKVANIGTRTVSGRKVLAKVLMPEGILWDDDTAFSGSLEDSDSTTKFNAQTGVYWKEYND
jgi:hypothetical protein